MVIVWLGPPKDQTPLLRDLIGFMSPDPKTYKIIPEHERDWMWDIDADKIIMLHRLIKKTIEDLQPDLILEPRFAHKWLSLDDLAGATEGKDIVDAVSILATNVKNELSDLIRRPWVRKRMNLTIMRSCWVIAFRVANTCSSLAFGYSRKLFYHHKPCS
jgi:hypothetical protein